MKNFVKYTLVSAAVAAAFGVAAGSLTTTALQVSKQGAAAAATTATQAASFTHTVAAGYAINDLVTFTVTSGAQASTHSWPATVNYAAGSGGATMVLTLLSGSTGTNTAQYRVTTVTATSTQTTIGAVSDVVPVTLKTNALIADATVSVASTLSNGITAIDPTTAVKIAEAKDQFGDLTVAGSAKFNGVIDVAAARKAFDTTTGATDAMTFTATVDNTLVAAVTPSTTVVTLKADLTDLPLTAVATAGAPTKTYNATAKELTLTYTGAVTTDTVTITPPTGTAAKTLVAGDFKLSGSVAFTGGSESIGANVDAGSWTLNGAMVNVPYMPFSSGSRIIYVTNTGTLDADVSLTAVDQAGMSYDFGVIGSAKKAGVTELSGLVNQAVASQFTPVDGNNKLSLTFTINAENKDVTVYASFNAGTDRVVVPTSQYKK